MADDFANVQTSGLLKEYYTTSPTAEALKRRRMALKETELTKPQEKE